MNKMLLGALFFFFSTDANEFVVKKKKEPSLGQLKEINCQLFGDYLKTVPVLLNEVSRVQLKAIDALQGYFESDKKSLCERMSKEHHKLCQQKIEAIHQQMEQLIETLQEFDQFCLTIGNKNSINYVLSVYSWRVSFTLYSFYDSVNHNV